MFLRLSYALNLCVDASNPFKIYDQLFSEKTYISDANVSSLQHSINTHRRLNIYIIIIIEVSCYLSTQLLTRDL